MESTERKPPVAVKAGATFRAFALIDVDYIQVHQSVLCPLCPVRYLLFVHFEELKAREQNQPEVRAEIAKYFFDMIANDHATGHLQDQFISPSNPKDEGV